MMLKYDVYAEIISDNLVITELIPTTQQYIIKIPASQLKPVTEFVTSLNSGKGEEKQREQIDPNDFIKRLSKFVQNKSLIAHFFGDSNPNNPYARQLEMFESLNRSISPVEEFQSTLLKKTVFIIGAGGVGTALANSLNACGVGKIIIADTDIIEETNLSRQFLYTHSDIGKYKVDVLATRLNNRGLGKVVPVREMITDNTINQMASTYPNVDLYTGIPFPQSDSVTKTYEDLLEKGYMVYAIGEHDAGPLFTSAKQINKARACLMQKYPMTKNQNSRRLDAAAHDRHPSFLPEILITTSLATAEIVKYLSQVAIMNTESSIYSLSSTNYTVKLIDLD